MKKLYFIILHYLVENETINCVESILASQEKPRFHIVIVDNGSPNKSGKNISNKYQDDNRVTVLINKENLGFAQGNNVGFKFAKKNNAQFIYMINNDTIISQKNCTEIIEKAFEKYQFHILGPDIILDKNNEHQNPAIPTIQDEAILKKMLFHHKILFFLSFLNIDIILPKIKKRVLNKTTSEKSKKKLDHTIIQKGVKLHGSAMVFSQKYIEKYDGLYPNTFMYSEEAILYFIAKRDELKTIYYPSLRIHHLEDKATNELVGTKSKKRRFYYKNYIKSGQELHKLMIKNSNG